MGNDLNTKGLAKVCEQFDGTPSKLRGGQAYDLRFSVVEAFL